MSTDPNIILQSFKVLVALGLRGNPSQLSSLRCLKAGSAGTYLDIYLSELPHSASELFRAFRTIKNTAFLIEEHIDAFYRVMKFVDSSPEKERARFFEKLGQSMYHSSLLELFNVARRESAPYLRETDIQSVIKGISERTQEPQCFVDLLLFIGGVKFYRLGTSAYACPRLVEVRIVASGLTVEFKKALFESYLDGGIRVSNLSLLSQRLGINFLDPEFFRYIDGDDRRYYNSFRRVCKSYSAHAINSCMKHLASEGRTRDLVDFFENVHDAPARYMKNFGDAFVEPLSKSFEEVEGVEESKAETPESSNHEEAFVGFDEERIEKIPRYRKPEFKFFVFILYIVSKSVSEVSGASDEIVGAVQNNVKLYLKTYSYHESEEMNFFLDSKLWLSDCLERFSVAELYGVLVGLKSYADMYELWEKASDNDVQQVALVFDALVKRCKTKDEVLMLRDIETVKSYLVKPGFFSELGEYSFWQTPFDQFKAACESRLKEVPSAVSARACARP